MAKVSTYFHALNVGVHDKTALARVDLERMRLAAEVQTNFLCSAVGPAFMRPATEYLTPTRANAEARLKEFVFGVSDAALMEFTASNFRVMVNDQIITRVAVSATVTNGDFSSATGWDTTSIGGATATITGGTLTLNAVNVESVAQCGRFVATSSPNVEHALRIVVLRGPVIFRCGTAAGADDYVSEAILPTGEHSLAFTPTGNFYVQFSNKDHLNRIVDSIQVEGAGQMVLPSPWALSDIPNLRISQSADVCFVACQGVQQRRIERRAARSWGVGTYTADDGPFSPNPHPTVRLRPTALEGDGHLLSTTSFFVPAHIGALFRLTHTGQKVTQTLSQEDTYTDYIRVSGIGGDRAFSITVTGTWVGTLTYQRSYDDPEAGYVDVSTITANGVYNVSDTADNAIYYYRIGFKPSAFTSGAAVIFIQYNGGGGSGVCRVVDLLTPTQAAIEILSPMKNYDFTRDWEPGEWSNYAGWPSAVALSDGRLWWSGADRIWGSVSDAFNSFDADTEGDSGPIARSIATGGVNDTKWLLSLQRLNVGTEGITATVRSSSLDEPLTPTNFGIKDSSTTGAAPRDPIKIDTRGIFVERAGTALMELTYSGDTNEYNASQISKLTTDLFESGVKSIAIQRRPDTRIWLVLEDGSAVCMVYEPDEQVLAFIPIETDGAYESVAVLPALVQDRVYFSIRRTVNGSTVRYIEKMAMDSEVKPATLCKVMDSFKVVTNAPASATVSGLSHLIGETVVVWADGAPIETSPGVRAEFVVSGGGTITLPSAKSNIVVGLPYRARWKSARLAYGAVNGTALLQKKVIDSLGMIMTDFVRAGIKMAGNFDRMYPLPEKADGTMQPAIVLSTIRDEESVVFPGEWNTDSRACIEVNSPYTATFLGLVMAITTNER